MTVPHCFGRVPAPNLREVSDNKDVLAPGRCHSSLEVDSDHRHVYGSSVNGDRVARGDCDLEATTGYSES